MDAPIIPEPILLAPRLDAKPWGSTNLSRFGIDLHGHDSVGEAVLTSEDVHIVGGRFDGETLGALIARNPEHLLGPHGYTLGGPAHAFPLLAKLIDANAFLSIQVHPTNQIAPQGSLGKTEAWYVIDAEPGASVLAGLIEGATEADVESALRSGMSIVPLVRSVPVRTGDMLFLPAGTIHALGSGIVIYEIQQPSFVTYRLEDWGRTREMHIDEGIDALVDSYRPEPIRAEHVLTGVDPVATVQCEYFALRPIHLGTSQGVHSIANAGPQVVTCISGSVELETSGGGVELVSGVTAVLFASIGSARIHAKEPSHLIHSWIP